ncbi:MAG: response regulator, partial [Parvularcula sp.]|nr:response regulator [Parvularcula sp.]
FTLRIKAAVTARPAVETAQPQTLHDLDLDDLRGLRVLVAEDIVVNRQVLAAICKPLDLHLTMAENGRDAMESLREGQFDAVLMDLRMPVMDGLEATRRIRAGEAGERSAEVPIIALTANAMQEHVDASLRAGADAHVAKPVNRAALVAALQKVLKSRDKASGAEELA